MAASRNEDVDLRAAGRPRPNRKRCGASVQRGKALARIAQADPARCLHLWSDPEAVVGYVQLEPDAGTDRGNRDRGRTSAALHAVTQRVFDDRL